LKNVAVSEIVEVADVVDAAAVVVVGV